VSAVACKKELGVQTVADSAYIAYRSLKGRISEELPPPEADPLCALLLHKIWRNGSSIGIAHLRIQLALPPSTLSTALKRLEARGLIWRYPSVLDGRYVDASLTRAGQLAATSVAETIADLEIDLDEAAGGSARYGFSRVAWMLATIDDESDPYRPLIDADGAFAADDDVDADGAFDADDDLDGDDLSS
jgi:DNA-binding MarR family transcriptional regulator